MSEQSKDGWQDIASAPKDGTVVDLWVVFPAIEGTEGSASRYADSYWDIEEGDWRISGFTMGQYLAKPYATHFMPLPTPPAKGD
jgi:hypothetical protein